MSNAETPPRRVRIGMPVGLGAYVASVRDFDRNVKLFLAVTAFRGMTVAALGTIFNLYLYSLGYDARFIGLINAFNGLAVLIVSVPVGYLADRIGRRPVLFAGGLVYPLSLLGLSFSTTTSVILVFNFIFGACAVSYWVCGVPMLFASTTSHNRVQAFSVNSFLLWGLGPVAAVAGGVIVDIAAGVLHASSTSSTALRAGMIFVVFLAAAGTVPYFFLREPESVAKHERQGTPPGRIVQLALRLLVPDLVLMFGVGSILTFSQLYFDLRFHLAPGAIGLVIGVGGTVAGSATLFTPRLSRAWGNLRTTVWLGWSAVPIMALLAGSTLLGFSLVAYWLVVALRGMIDPAYTAFVQERVPESYRARMTGLYSVTYSLGFSLGPVASGQLQKVGGFTPAFLMGATCYFAGAVLLFLFFGQTGTSRSGSNSASALP
jgi:MFS family permease